MPRLRGFAEELPIQPEHRMPRTCGLIRPMRLLTPLYRPTLRARPRHFRVRAANVVGVQPHRVHQIATIRTIKSQTADHGRQARRNLFDLRARKDRFHQIAWKGFRGRGDQGNLPGSAVLLHLGKEFLDGKNRFLAHQLQYSLVTRPAPVGRTKNVPPARIKEWAYHVVTMVVMRACLGRDGLQAADCGDWLSVDLRPAFYRRQADPKSRERSWACRNG